MRRSRLLLPLLVVALAVPTALPTETTSNHARMAAYRTQFAAVYGQFFASYKKITADVTLGQSRTIPDELPRLGPFSSIRLSNEFVTQYVEGCDGSLSNQHPSTSPVGYRQTNS